MYKMQFLIAFLLCTEVMANDRPGSNFDLSNDGLLDTRIRLENDNLGSRKGGNDYGHTHSTEIALGKEVKGLYLEINYESSLYTKLGGPGYIYITPDGDSQYDLYFTEENAVRLLLSNIDPDKKVYWRVGLGWVQLNSEDGGNIFTATGQQEFVHRLIKLYDRRAGAKPIYLDDGLGQRDAFEVSAALGLQNELIFGEEDSFRLRGQTEIKAVQSGISGADYIEGVGRADLFYQKSEKNLAFRLGAETRVRKHDLGTQTTAVVVAGVGRNRWNVEARGEKVVSGQLHNYQTYNTEKEPTYSIQFRRKFGKKRD